ncbi:MAG: hypothetical protein OH316_01665 [Candidatus Parvarchaeota archaeon]|nr:hypothetical protein [Candidatus Parvarchaeota archaeon]MCW1301821.1 hypothetical protein [Candidatus Parvarchaeota archaeon]
MAISGQPTQPPTKKSLSQRIKGGIGSIGSGISSRYTNWKTKRAAKKQSLQSLSPREQLAQLELNKMKAQSRRKRIGLGGVVLIVLILGVGGWLFVSSGIISHTGIFSYQIGGFYGPYISIISGYISSTTSSITSFLSNPEGYITNYFFPKTTSVQTPITTFTSFVSITPPATEQSLYITSSSASSSANTQDLLFIADNLANVPLGSNYLNKLKFNVTCAPGDNVCTNLTDLAGGELVQPNVIFQNNQLQLSAPVNVHCPTNNKALAKQLPVQTSVNIIADTTNYTAASLLNLEYINSTFYNELISSSQAILPTQEATVIPSQGPLEVIPNLGQSEPLQNDQNASISITIDNLGSGSYALNNLTIYIPETDPPAGISTDASTIIPGGGSGSSPAASSPSMTQSNGYELQGIDYLNSLTFQCVSLSTGANNGLNIVQNFAFPTYGYIKCWPLNLNQNSFLFQFSNFFMQNNEHFETMPVLLQINYNYTSTASLPFYVINDTTCAGS